VHARYPRNFRGFFTFPSPARTPVGGIQEFKVRVVTLDGAPWFVVADVCRALGILNVSNAVRALAGDEVTLHRIKGQRGLPMDLVAESGLYKLIPINEPGQFAADDAYRGKWG
jgi:hypothetical protein